MQIERSTVGHPKLLVTDDDRVVLSFDYYPDLGELEIGASRRECDYDQWAHFYDDDIPDVLCAIQDWINNLAR